MRSSRQRSHSTESEWTRGKGVATRPSPRRSRASGSHAAAVVALLLCVGATSLGASAGVARTQAAGILDVTYVGSTSLLVRLGDGSTVRSGGTIPAGQYQVLVEDDDFPSPSFKMSGPGVSISSNLDSSGMGIDHPATFGPFIFQPTSSYTLQDANIGGSSVVTFATSATAASSGSSNGTAGSSSSGASSGPQSSSSSSSTKALGTLTASVSTAGKTALAFGGKTVKQLKAGRYTIRIQDHSNKAGLILWKLGSHSTTMSGAAATGPKSASVTLSAGKWFLAPSMSGPRTYFSVTT